MAMRLGIALGMTRPTLFEPITVESERLGFDSVWLPEHLVFPIEMKGSPFPGDDHPPVPPRTPVFDALAYLSFLAGRTTRIRLGTHVFLLGLRHPFVSARAVQTLDVVSQGRAEIGIGAGWLHSEWRATGLDPRTRGRRLDEALDVCKRLWSEPVVEHHGEFFDFEPVMFEPKPVQKPHPPVYCGGESEAALRRAARACSGWIGLQHTPESVVPLIARLGELRREFGRERDAFEVIVGGRIERREDLARWEDTGVTRLVLAPWRRSTEALEALRRTADFVF